MRALWSRVIYSLLYSWLDNFTWEAELPMCSSCMCVLNMHFAACWGLRDTHPPIQLGDHICLCFYQQFINSFASLNMYTSTNVHVCWGFLFEQVFIFYWILQGCTYCQWILFEQLVSSTIVWKSVRTLFEQLVSSTIVWKSVKMLKRSTILFFSPCWVH